MNNLQLSLKGSQINLATRDKSSGTAIRYNYTRPESAEARVLLSSSYHRELNYLNKRLAAAKRPQSADTSLLYSSNNKYFSGDYADKKTSTPTSSTNLYKLLISEPVHRSWAARKDSDCSLGAQIKKKAATTDQSDQPDNNSSMDEESMSADTPPKSVYTNNFNDGRAPSSSPTTRPSSYFAQNIGVKDKLTNFETQSPPLKSSLTKTWAGDATERKKSDLPGRVSFSTNDVYEIDYSDCEEREISSSEPPVDETTKPACCPANCLQPFDEFRARRVIEDYKNEIDDINHRHKLELHMTDQQTTKSNNNGKEFDPASKSQDAAVEEYYNCIKEIEESGANDEANKADRVENTSPPPNFNDNLSFSENVSSSSDTVKDNLNQSVKLVSDSTTSVIKNYLKVKSQRPKVDNNAKKPVIASNKRVNMPPPPIRPKPMSASIQRRKPSSLKKSKSISCLKDDSSLDEFHMDKVVSWMSSHDDARSDITDLTHPNYPPYPRSVGKNAKSEFERNEFKDDDEVAAETSFDDYVAVIKEIENSSKNSAGFDELKTDVDFRLNTLLKSMETPDSALDVDTRSSQSKQDIFSYLDNVDSSCDKTIKSVKYDSRMFEEDDGQLAATSEADIIEEVPKISDLMMLPNHLLAKKIVTLSLRTNELSNAIQLSKEHVANVRTDRQKALRLEKSHTQARLKEQKKQYEDIVARHQSFIEQLIKDKSELCDKVTQLTRRIDSQNQAWDHRLKTEIERAKETVLAGEKIKREKWVRDNTKKIKDLTVKGLELEINRMTTEHKREIAEIRAEHKQVLQDALDAAKQRFEQQEKTIRDSYAQDREGAIEKERLAIKERFQNQMEDERKLFEDQKLRLQKELEKEKLEYYKEIKAKESHFDAKKEEIVNDHIEMLEQIKYDFKEKLKQRELKHQNELSKLREHFESDFSIWKREFEAATKLRECEKENQIRHQCRLERDHQIETIVNKMDDEALKHQQEFELKLSRLREKFEAEIRDLEFNEKSVKEKFVETRSKLAESEANIQNLEATVKQLQIQLGHTQNICDTYTKEKESMKESARQEIQSELKALQRDHSSEIHRIYTRVQQAIEKKDQTIEVLQTDNSTLKERCSKLETVIRQQRKDYCTK